MTVIRTENHGPLIVASTYWDSEQAKSGKVYVSVNAGAIRVMVPACARQVIEECRSSQYAILSRGPWPEQGLQEAAEILWEDKSDSPYSMHLSVQSFDALPAEPPAGQEWVISLWDLKKGRPHKALERKCYWRRVPRIPWLKPWE